MVNGWIPFWNLLQNKSCKNWSIWQEMWNYEIKNIYSSLKTIEETNDAYSIPFLTWHHSVYGVSTQCETVLCNLQQTWIGT